MKDRRDPGETASQRNTDTRQEGRTDLCSLSQPSLTQSRHTGNAPRLFRPPVVLCRRVLRMSSSSSAPLDSSDSVSSSRRTKRLQSGCDCMLTVFWPPRPGQTWTGWEQHCNPCQRRLESRRNSLSTVSCLAAVHVAPEEAEPHHGVQRSCTCLPVGRSPATSHCCASMPWGSNTSAHRKLSTLQTHT